MTQLSSHIFHYIIDTWVALVLLESLEQVELRVLLNLNVEIIEGTDRSVTSEEVVRTGTEADDLQVLQTYDSTCDRQELMDHLSTLGSVANGLLRDVSASLAQAQSLAGVQHTAVSVATTVDQVLLSLLSSSTEHSGSLEPVGQHGLRNLRTEVAQVYAEGVTACLCDILQCLLGVDLTLNDTDRTLVDAFLTKLLLLLSDNSLTTVNSQ